jgi:hypothetical protein
VRLTQRIVEVLKSWKKIEEAEEKVSSKASHVVSICQRHPAEKSAYALEDL